MTRPPMPICNALRATRPKSFYFEEAPASSTGNLAARPQGIECIEEAKMKAEYSAGQQQ